MPRDREQSAWTLDTLYTHLTALIEQADRRSTESTSAQKEMVKLALESARVATDKAERASERRFESVNEFRGALGDQAKTLISRTEVEQQLKAMTEKLDATATRLNLIDGRASGYGSLLGWIVAFVGVLVAVMTFLMKK